MKTKLFLLGLIAIGISLFGGFPRVNAQTTYSIRVLVGDPDCEALSNCDFTIYLYEYSSSLGSKYMGVYAYYSYGTSTYNLGEQSLDQGYTEFYVTMIMTGQTCYNPYHNVTSPHWVPDPPPYSHTFEVNPCGW